VQRSSRAQSEARIPEGWPVSPTFSVTLDDARCELYTSTALHRLSVQRVRVSLDAGFATNCDELRLDLPETIDQVDQGADAVRRVLPSLG